MKQFLYTLLVMIAGIACISSCKNKFATPPNESIAQLIDANSDYSILDSALVRTGYKSILSTSPSLTLFAPNNAAFAAAGYTLDSIKTMDTARLNKLIGYHLIGEALTPGNIKAQSRLQTLNGQYIYTSHTAIYGSRVNGLPIENSYIAASNGIIHAISQLLVSPTKTLQQFLEADTTLSLYRAALNMATDTITVFNTTVSYHTLFAPVNNAFRQAGLGTVTALSAALTTDSILKLVNHHYISATLWQTGDFIYNTQVTTASDSLIILNTEENSSNKQLGVYVRNRPALFFVPFLTKDSFATNGIIHKVDTLFWPNR
ncbi:Uncaracterized surface protein containing fasciclin (FAS1) repeats [Filimonas lacunae]|uniref:Uncaracterized surface protein containing fasciclin (FAS1) repeats n=1 Tax=Filimonas lacunae TaxID=477680 RepID=A0A173MJI8_9BACT|nr:fasciclin domain-containing protein [Filimonas lacunae]BAV07647.1 transforming growth factor-beta induced protein IG-H3 precursor [Filimonas lacunae]SIT29704.1 Uncaracterized surface protein containing fasciclin (FAS1) repeats [Filimonas lacunae]